LEEREIEEKAGKAEKSREKKKTYLGCVILTRKEEET